MNHKPVFFVTGMLLLILSAAMLVPMITDLANRNADWRVFAGAEISAAFAGFLLIFTNREREFRMTVRETFLTVFLGWIFMGAFGALPFCLSGLNLDVAHGFFEAMSGLTTTGMTVVTGLDGQPHGILLWRAILHWLGGIGALALSLSLLPHLQVSGMQVFKAQSFDIAKILPSASQTGAYILLIYSGLTAVCALLLDHAGMSLFEAACHAMAAISTGGFSTSDDSVGHFDSAMIESILMYFMILGSLPFTLYLRMARGDLMILFRDNQVRAFLSGLAVLALTYVLYLLAASPLSLSGALRQGTFKAVTLMTTSGFTLHDGGIWGPFAAGIGFLAAFIGGCSGSAAGGIRVFRFQILLSVLKLQVRRLIVPDGVFQAYHNKKPLDAATQNAVLAFLFAFVLLVAAAGILLMMTGLEFQTAFGASFAALTNTGPALTGLVGPVTAYGALSPPALWILSACMLLGRLEIFGALVFFAPRFWRG